ncbi:AmpG family muropeptide MFS transporter [Candidatus Methylospira mobilis]|uniref:AmpG family muropeptide MFS transporter n=1 Tax=Candidatus Methylospira mobilis TaxID=1808979 RepID=A0A5Q0BNX1_9GAMM|nr:AmpG family muropeptide MFS transporter [Candidatus Methylospira mobilis]QFY43446.1 AmpG family muropeptide MFS transporter [Candidatus Methylospira mobilis]WNV03315.1 AmpG family muropeptide MFS transporter [Candidatus Methylospira mobilis]
MTSASEPAAVWYRIYFTRRILGAFFTGFYGGLPLLLTGSVLQAWLKQEGVDLATIGLYALVGLPYTLKFLWAPVFDRYRIRHYGRRRGWLILTQAALALALALLAFSQPALHPILLAGLALLVTFFSASQDTLIDAWRRESLSDYEQGLGASFYVNGYRLGMLLASGGGLILADLWGFTFVYLLMAAVMLSGAMVSLILPEPEEAGHRPKRFAAAVIQPFIQFFERQDAWWILLFILLYKMGDTIAGQMSTPFYLDMGYSKTEIGAIVKLFGFWATLIGGFVGGTLILRVGIYRALWQFGILQAFSTAAFAALTQIPPQLPALGAVICFENLSAGMGTAAFVGFMASQTDRRFTATQYALLSSLMGVPRVLIAAPSGWMASSLGWWWFFLGCSLLAIPGLLLLIRFRNWLR